MARLAHYVMASEWRAALIASLLLFLPYFRGPGHLWSLYTHCAEASKIVVGNRGSCCARL